jgi:diguanylate cyclase (GGDEF)-like protein
MQVEIADSLYEEYQQLVKKHHLADDVLSRLQRLIENDLRSWRGRDEIDRLTGCKTKEQLSEDIRRAATSEDGEVFYRSDFACLDIEDFMTYLNTTGLAAGDRVLQDIGKQLREIYSDASVYRFGGDEFVVELKGRQYSPVQTPHEIGLKHSIVRIAAKKNWRRNHHVNRLIIFHFDKGIVEATHEGTEIACEIVAP